MPDRIDDNDAHAHVINDKTAASSFIGRHPRRFSLISISSPQSVRKNITLVCALLTVVAAVCAVGIYVSLFTTNACLSAAAAAGVEEVVPSQATSSANGNSITAIEQLPNVRITYAKPETRSRAERCSLVKGRRIHINYGGNCCRNSQPLNCKTGLEAGALDMCVSFTENSLDDDFRRRNAHILATNPGGGLWLWKPYIILKTLLAMEEDDVLLYTDSGCQILDNMDRAHVCLQAKLQQDVVLFAYAQPERHRTKGDAFLLMDCNFNNTNCSNTEQFLGSPSLWRKTLRSIQFVGQWLSYAQDYRIIGNDPSKLAKDSPDFKAHRNDWLKSGVFRRGRIHRNLEKILLDKVCGSRSVSRSSIELSSNPLATKPDDVV